ncbi:MAG: hypothetical protein C4346_05350 [Chloroflexota bacterium]
METYNIYMDELPAGSEQNGEGLYEVQFRVVPNSMDEGEPETNAVLANLNIYDLIDLRDAIQQVLDDLAISAVEGEAEEGEILGEEEDVMP